MEIPTTIPKISGHGYVTQADFMAWVAANDDVRVVTEPSPGAIELELDIWTGELTRPHSSMDRAAAS